MKITDIKVGDTYASSAWGTKVTVNAIHLGGALPEGFKYYRSGSWHGSTYADKKLVLVTDEHGSKYCVNPQRIKAQWDEYEAAREADHKRRQEAVKLAEEESEARKIQWLKLAPALEAAGINAYPGLQWGQQTIEVTVEQLEALLGGK